MTNDLKKMKERIDEIVQLLEVGATADGDEIDRADLASELLYELLPALTVATVLAREEYEAASEAKTELMKKPEIKHVFDAITTTRKQRSDAEDGLREAAVAVYREEGEVEPSYGVSIALHTAIEYDEEEAVKWAEQNAPALIVKTINRKALEALVSAGEKPDFVTVKKEPRARIASDLSEKAIIVPKRVEDVRP